MPQQASLEQRVAALEQEVAALKTEIKTRAASADDNWIEKISGTFKDDPEFGEILRLGAEIRRADRPEDIGP